MVITDVIGVGTHFEVEGFVGVEVDKVVEVVVGSTVELDELDVSRAMGMG